jgi:hypothetical protein
LLVGLARQRVGMTVALLGGKKTYRSLWYIVLDDGNKAIVR